MSSPPTSPFWSTHRIVLAALAAAAAVLTFVLWFHPTAGYADQGSIIAGADLRGSLTLILWSALFVFAAISSGVIAFASRYTSRRPVLLGAGYVVAAATMPLFGIVIDKFV